jgi:hypothetical protein
LEHVGIHIWVCFNDGVAGRVMLLDLFIDQAQAESDVEEIPSTGSADLLGVLDHQRALPAHHDSLA